MRHLSKSQVVDLQFYVQEPPEAAEATHIFVISITVCSITASMRWTVVVGSRLTGESCTWKAKGVFGCGDIHLEPLFCLWTFVVRVLHFSLRADVWRVKSCHPDKIIQSLPSFSYCCSMVVPWLRKATERLCGVRAASHTRWPVRYKWKSKGGWCFEESEAGRRRLLCVNQRGGNRVRWGGKQKDGLPLTSHCGRHSAGWDVRDICGIGACSCTRDKERIHCQRPQRDSKRPNALQLHSDLSTCTLGTNIDLHGDEAVTSGE